MPARALVVEDCQLNRLRVASTLRSDGFDAVTATDVAEALRSWQTIGGNIDLLVTDVDLGGGPDGWELARHLRHTHPALAIVYLTAHGAEEWAAEGVPGSLHVRKPCSAHQLRARVATFGLPRPAAEASLHAALRASGQRLERRPAA